MKEQLKLSEISEYIEIPKEQYFHLCEGHVKYNDWCLDGANDTCGDQPHTSLLFTDVARETWLAVS